jgi:hypothetical protein
MMGEVLGGSLEVHAYDCIINTSFFFDYIQPSVSTSPKIVSDRTDPSSFQKAVDKRVPQG